MPAKKDRKPEYAQLSLKIDKALNDELEVFWRKNLYQDKSSLVREAIDYYIHAEKCSTCGAVNPNKATSCAICGAKLTRYTYKYDLLLKACEAVFVGAHSTCIEAHSLKASIEELYDEVKGNKNLEVFLPRIGRFYKSKVSILDDIELSFRAFEKRTRPMQQPKCNEEDRLILDKFWDVWDIVSSSDSNIPYDSLETHIKTVEKALDIIVIYSNEIVRIKYSLESIHTILFEKNR